MGSMSAACHSTSILVLHNVAPDFTAFATFDPGTTLGAHYVSFAKGVRRRVYTQDIALLNHLKGLSVVCGASASSFRPHACEWTVSSIFSIEIFYTPPCVVLDAQRSTGQTFRDHDPAFGISCALRAGAAKLVVRHGLPAIFAFRIVRR
jgi:hypothetical protein